MTMGFRPLCNWPRGLQPRAAWRENERDRERASSRGGGELPARTIMRGSVPFVYFNSSLLVLLIFLIFLLFSLF